jgi:hypothetical protein
MSSGQHWVADQEASLRDFTVGQTVYLRDGHKATVTGVLWSSFRIVVSRDGSPGEESMYPSDLSTTPPAVATGGQAHVVALEKRLERLDEALDARITALDAAVAARLTALETGAEEWARTERDRADCEEDREQSASWARKVDARLERLERVAVPGGMVPIPPPCPALPEASLPEPEPDPDEDDRVFDACRACGLEWTATGRGCPVCAPRRGPELVACPACGYDITPICAKPEPKPELPNPGVEFALRTDRDAIERILAKIRTILGTPDLADVVEQAERVVAERDAAVRRSPDEPGLERSIAMARTPRHKELVATFGRGVGADAYIAELLVLPDLVRRAAGEIKDRTLREALLADLEALLHPRKS